MLYQQLRELVSSLLIGGILGALLHLHQLAIAESKTSRLFVHLADTLFWLLAVVLVFAGLIPANGGRFRFYILLLIAAGMGIYRLYLARRFFPLLRGLASPLGKIITAAFLALSWPLRWQRPGGNPPGNGDGGAED